MDGVKSYILGETKAGTKEQDMTENANWR